MIQGSQLEILGLMFGCMIAGTLIGWGYRGLSDRARKRYYDNCVEDEK